MEGRAGQERLWITEPRRVTCLCTVTAVQGDRFVVDRALFAPRSRAVRHPQYADAGTVWWDGEKRRLASVEDRDGTVWYRLRGTVPEVGVELQCQLDQDIGDLNDRAHTAMHLLIAALQQAGAPPMTADPEVKGGGNARLTFQRPVARNVLAAAVQRVTQWIQADVPVQRAWATRAEAERFATVQNFSPFDPVPGGDPVPLVRIEGVCVFGCDGTHADRTGRVGGFGIGHAAQGKEGFVVVGRVL